MNPNNNKHFNDEALRINRMLKKENDKLRDVIKEVDEYILHYVVYNIEDLLKVTRSCEAFGNLMHIRSVESGIKNLLVDNRYEDSYKYYRPGDELPECNDCFWCLEKTWAINEAKKKIGK